MTQLAAVKELIDKLTAEVPEEDRAERSVDVSMSLMTSGLTIITAYTQNRTFIHATIDDILDHLNKFLPIQLYDGEPD